MALPDRDWSDKYVCFDLEYSVIRLLEELIADV
jgi:hypothetical protein